MRMMRSLTVLAAVALLMSLAAPAFAHVTANPNTAPSEGFFTTFFRVGHGCDTDGPDTTSVEIQIPDGVLGATPEEEPGWTSEVKMKKLDEPIEGAHGEEITELPDTVTFTADDAPLGTHHFREFGISLNLSAADQEVLYFPTVQTCEEGELRWVNIPETVEAWGDTEDPAPYLLLEAGGGHGGEEEEDDEMGSGAEPGMAVDLSADDIREIAAEEASAVEEDSGSDSLVWVALALGAIGFLLGVGAFMRSGRKEEPSS